MKQTWPLLPGRRDESGLKEMDTQIVAYLQVMTNSAKEGKGTSKKTIHAGELVRKTMKNNLIQCKL